jgi:hypothetical protein
VIRGDPTLAVRRTGQRHLRRLTRYEVRDLDGVSDRIDIRVAGLKMLIDPDTATRPDFQTRSNSKFILRARDGKLPPGHDKMTCDVALALPTFSATAQMADISRVMGGYHIQSDNLCALELGRKVAEYEWPKMQEYFNGTAQPTARR